MFEKTHRFQVDGVFLLDAASLALVSFASCDGQIRSDFGLSNQRTAIARQGSFACLVAIIRGRSNELVIADLDVALRRIENRFRSQFLEQGSALLRPLQPFLEDCLLIQAPASSA